MSGSSEAAGGVVVRDGLVAVVHRPRYDDWSLPKGKLDPCESFEQAALREVEEETGLRARLVRELPSVEYEVRGRPKLVRYWLMEVVEDPGRLRVGFTVATPIDADADEVNAGAAHDAAKLLEELGHHVSEIDSCSDDPWEDFRRSGEFTPYTAIFNVTGQPAISLPLFHGEDGLPLAVQLAGKPAGEAQLLALAAQLEAASPWADRRPDVTASSDVGERQQ